MKAVDNVVSESKEKIYIILYTKVAVSIEFLKNYYKNTKVHPENCSYNPLEMVSTRGIRYRFSEGERVLCYEPDPTKAKVLYDSKVLEVIEGKDKRGRRTIEYLIHFQGWNSSWDRCVNEDFVLKDTEENRQLQRDLAEKSQLQLGAYLYRRERKKIVNATTAASAAKRARQGFSDDGSSSSTQPDEVETGDTDSSSGCSSTNAHQGRAHLPLPSALRDRLTFDYHLVVKRGRLSKLPASPCAAEILESFVKWFARAGAWTPQRGRHDPPQKPDMLDVSCRLNLVREVADGLRVYFDFVLRGHLLYKQELYQYQEICGQFIETTTDEDEEEEDEEEEIHAQNGDDGSQSQEEGAAMVEEEMLSPRIPEYAHLPPDPDADNEDRREPAVNNHENSNHVSNQNNTEQKVDSPSEENHTDGAKEKENIVGACTRSGNVARRLRSHKSAVSQSENEEPVPSTSTVEPRTTSHDTLSSSVGSSGSSLSECWARPTQSTKAPSTTRTPLSLLFDKVAKWQIIPREGTENLPCRIYGAIHLARLFVKLPDFLNATQMPDFKLKLILKLIEMFVQYLDEHSEWFGEMYYIADNNSRPH